jgi:hypothetical protein
MPKNISKNIPEDVSYRSDDLRRELESKIEARCDKLDFKIENKISNSTFWAIVTIVALVLGGIFFWLMNVNSSLSRIETLSEVQQNKANAKK